jgi:hypothetical protein
MSSHVIEPCTPDEAKAAKVATIPWMILAATNELLAERYGSSIRIDVNDIIGRAQAIERSHTGVETITRAD